MSSLDRLRNGKDELEMNDSSLDELNEDLRLLFLRTGPRPEPVDVEGLIGSTSDHLDRSANNASRRRLKMTLRTAGFVAAAACLVLLLKILITSSDGHAFAQVQAQIEQARTVDFIRTATHLGDPPEGSVDTRFGKDENAQSVLRKEISSLESRLATADAAERKDIGFRLSLLRPFLRADLKQLPDDIRRVRIKGKHLQRTDHMFPFGQFHGVINARTGESVSFDHEKKTKEVLKTQVLINSETGETREHAIDISPAVDFFTRFRAVPAEATQQLPKQQIDGKDAMGFRSVDERDDGTWTRTYLVDRESNLPIRIIHEFASAKKGLGSSRWVEDHFVFDAELDDGLFSTETPAGYESKDGRVLGIEF